MILRSGKAIQHAVSGLTQTHFSDYIKGCCKAENVHFLAQLLQGQQSMHPKLVWPRIIGETSHFNGSFWGLKYFSWSDQKWENFQTNLSLALDMAQCGPSQAAPKRELDRLLAEIYQIDLQIQIFRQQGNSWHIANLKAAKLELRKRVVDVQT